MSSVISLIIPTYNERDNIAPLIERIDGALSAYDYEIVFVDDDSGDGTAEIASSLSSRYPVRVIVRRDERGLASAVVEGLKQVKGQMVAVMDADLQHPPEVLAEMAKVLENGAEIAVASRYVAGGGCQGWGLVRRIISKGAVFLAHLLLPATRGIKDPMSGFFMLDRRVVEGADLRPTGYKILLEILMMGQFRSVTEVPYTFKTRTRGESKLSARQQIDYLKHIYSLMRRKGELLRFAKFCLVGLSGVFVNMGLLWLLTEVAGLFYLLSAAISIETSVLTNFTLNDLFTFHDRRSSGIKPLLKRLGKFNLVSLGGVGINMAILWLLTEHLGLYYLLSNLCGIAVATLWNYSVNTMWTWKK
ncbi:MAG: glycosyltransferase family 2 protein [Dehalococcoidia bacterium]|nr:glycosyltransferase family 2 protein [Dehalococcoidia bacterium]